MSDEQNDHDIIIEVRTEMRGMRSDLKELRDGTYNDIASLKRDKADNKEVERLQGLINDIQKKVNNDIEIRVRAVEECTIPPSEHKELLKQTNTNGIYLIIGIILIGILVAIMSVHIIGIRLP